MLYVSIVISIGIFS